MRNAKKDFWEGTASSFDCLSKGQKVLSRWNLRSSQFSLWLHRARVQNLWFGSCVRMWKVSSKCCCGNSSIRLKFHDEMIRWHYSSSSDTIEEYFQWEKTFEMKHKTAMKHIDVEHGKFARFRAASGVYDCCCKQRLWKIESSFSNHDLNWLPQTMRARIQNSWGFKLQLKLFRSLADFWSFRVENSSEFDSINDDASSQQPTCWQNVN